MLALDIDFFKKFNDTFGHHAGDRVLTRVAAAAQGALRQIDRLGRIGGEEFLAVLPDTGAEAGAQVAERVRSCVEDLDLDDIAEGIQVTISIGVAELHPADADFKALVARADRALYRAKANGRNRVEPD
ncbi:GGDEF domain-containing protein, partial [Lysobacter sp. D1-1-M9]|uniref:GGDEF domain-containing protein n=1 Tax=Novilysobacter longmucuonensis TaxID=3098603 RepID=UPI002FC66738